VFSFFHAPKIYQFNLKKQDKNHTKNNLTIDFQAIEIATKQFIKICFLKSNQLANWGL